MDHPGAEDGASTAGGLSESFWRAVSAAPATRFPPGRRGASGWRALGLFWAGLLLAAGLGAGTLQWLGPPPGGQSAAPGNQREAAARPPASAPPARPGQAAGGGAGAATVPAAVTIAAPDPALSEPSERFPGTVLPKIAADGRKPMNVYARPFDMADHRPRVALLVAGIGLSTQASLDAVRDLPGAVTLAVSPYAADPAPLLAAARKSGHEFLVSIPMEPLHWPLDDPGPHALMSGADAARNREALDWTLTRLQGYAGATGALGTLRGERFAGSGAPYAAMLARLDARGLAYVDPRPGHPDPSGVAGRTADMIVDEMPASDEIDARLSDLEAIARIRGSALGLVEAPRPVTLARIAAWAKGLGARGVALAPVTAVLAPPHPGMASPGISLGASAGQETR